MSKKLRLIKTNIYVKHDQLKELEDADFIGLQDSLKNYISARGNGKNCVSIVRVIPTLASENTVDVELVAFREDIDFVNETDADDGIRSIIDNYLDIDLGHFFIKQTLDSITIMGDLE